MLDDVSFSIAKKLKSSPVNDSGKPVTMSLMFGMQYLPQRHYPHILLPELKPFTKTHACIDTGGGPQMGLDPRITQAYYAQVVGAKATDSTNTAYKFPCDAVLPDILLNFATGGTVGLSGYSLSFNNPDADNSECTLLPSLTFTLCLLLARSHPYPVAPYYIC
jgi:hypothetical protein